MVLIYSSDFVSVALEIIIELKVQCILKSRTLSVSEFSGSNNSGEFRTYSEL